MKPVFFYLTCLAAAVVPFWPAKPNSPAASPVPVAWPQSFAGVPLTQIPIPVAEQAFYADFPGAAARFTDGRREFIFRWLTAGTRRLHPSADCFRALGYEVQSPTLEHDTVGQAWSTAVATRGLHRLRIRERIVSTGDPSAAWTDVSAWYWSTLLPHTAQSGPWLATTIIEADRS